MSAVRRIESVDYWEPNVFDDEIEGGSLSEICAVHARGLLEAVRYHASDQRLRHLIRLFGEAVKQ